ncbi:hypothetical protein [Paraburkholderia phosphatilytica]|uniref:hypothetical protein n=1 Tax=Paraburkholderia phosphatilytica TaxID=2282883 RepID=UPI000E46BDF7|nr:hypothetical protein [Paraburkholderia phosphatilytica]
MSKLHYLTHIRLRDAAENQQVFLKPQDFAAKSVGRVLLDPIQRHMYAALRVHGVTAMESFIACFGYKLLGRPELFEQAATHYETTRLYIDEVEEIANACDVEYLDEEHLARLVEFVSASVTEKVTNMYPTLVQKYDAPVHRTPTSHDVEHYNDLVKSRLRSIQIEQAEALGSDGDRINVHRTNDSKRDHEED